MNILRRKLSTKVLAITLSIMIVLGLTLGLISITEQSNTMQSDKEKQLKSVVSVIKDSDITEDSLNEFKQSTGITIRVFNGNIR